jgi:hypothetical protein
MDRARLISLLACLAILPVAGAIGAGVAGGQDRADELRNRIEGQRGRERRLAGAVARLGRLERATAREVAIQIGRAHV